MQLSKRKGDRTLRHINPELREKRRAAGRLGGRATLEKYGREELRRRAKLGGRPRSLTLAEMEAQLSSRETNKRRKGLPPRERRGLLQLKYEGELTGHELVGSPERGC